MRVLGIDSATSRASVGLWLDGSVLVEQHTTSRNHASSLLPLIESVLNEVSAKLVDLDLLAVSSGPGSFSGLRVALSVAKGLALASSVPVVAISTLEALAATAVEQGGVICSLLDAHKGEVYQGCFESKDGVLTRLSDDVVVTPEQAVESMMKPCTIVGDAPAQYEVIRACADRGVTVLPFPEFGPRGGTVAEIGARRFQCHGAVEISSLEPFYVRPPEVHINV